MIDSELRAQMIAYTADDAPPPDLVRRVRAGVRRTHSRRLARWAAWPWRRPSRE